MAWLRKLAVVALILGAVAAFWPEAHAPAAAEPVATPDPTRFHADWWQSDEARCPDGSRLTGAVPPDGNEVWCARTDGTRHGQHIGWWPNGRKAFHRHYRDGRMHGSAVEWREDGRTSSAGSYRDGLRHGRWVTWSPGAPAVVETYDAGRKPAR